MATRYYKKRIKNHIVNPFFISTNHQSNSGDKPNVDNIYVLTIIADFWSISATIDQLKSRRVRHPPSRAGAEKLDRIFETSGILIYARMPAAHYVTIRCAWRHVTLRLCRLRNNPNYNPGDPEKKSSDKKQFVKGRWDQTDWSNFFKNYHQRLWSWYAEIQNFLELKEALSYGPRAPLGTWYRARIFPQVILTRAH